MAYDVILAQRIKDSLSGVPGLQEMKMFGGVGFLINGNMACGVHGDDLIVRIGPEKHQAALNQPYVKPFDLTGKSMSGWIVVVSDGIHTSSELMHWVSQGVEFAKTLPVK